MKIYLTTERWISLWISNICKFEYGKWRYEQEAEFKEKVSNAKDKLKMINELSMWRFEKITDTKFKSRDCYWNIIYLYVITL